MIAGFADTQVRGLGIVGGSEVSDFMMLISFTLNSSQLNAPITRKQASLYFDSE